MLLLIIDMGTGITLPHDTQYHFEEDYVEMDESKNEFEPLYRRNDVPPAAVT